LILDNLIQKTKLFFDDFTKNVIYLASSTFLIYGIMYIAVPIISRIYGPNEYGKYTTLFSLIMLSSILANGKYDIAILLPKDRKEAFSVFQLSLTVSIVISILVLGGLNLVHFLKFDNLVKFDYLFQFSSTVIVSVYINAITLNTLLINWVSRNKEFKLLSISRLVRFSLALIFSIGIGSFFKTFIVLLIGDIIGLVLSSCYLYFKTLKKEDFDKTYKLKEITAVAKRYSEFPKYSLPSSFLNKVITQSPVFLLNYFFTPVHVGNYGMCERLLGTPTSLISEATSNVFRGELSASGDGKNQKSLFKKILLRLVVIAIPIFTVLYFVGGELIKYMFGEQWILAVIYSKYLIFSLIFQFVFTPLTFILFYFEKQKLEFKIQIFSLIMLAASVFIFKNYILSDLFLIKLLIVNTIIRISLEFLFSFKVISKRN
jgi:O-antigen/teichoic acid export membrane protein